jgi:hypothetical protein
MEFEEKKCIKIPVIKEPFIYFLTQNNKVVYVGQTKKGIQRPLQHIKDKDFDNIFVKFCNEKELDNQENKYILKYKPKYNKDLNYNEYISLRTLLKEMKKNVEQYNLWKLRKDIKKLSIEIIEISNKEKISINDAIKVINYRYKLEEVL